MKATFGVALAEISPALASARTLKWLPVWNRQMWQNCAKSRRRRPTEKHKQLFHSLAQYARMNGAWITSPPGQKWLRLETPSDSTLPDKLFDAGYSLQEIGTGERIEAGRILPTRVYQFRIS